MDSMFSARAAADVLAALTGTGARQARQVLDCGLAGEPLRERGSHLYPEAAIAALVDRPLLDPDEPSPRWSGLVVLRRSVPASWDWQARAEAISTGWDIPVTTLVHLTHQASAGPVLALGCVSGFVVTVAQVLDAGTAGRGRRTTWFALGAPPAGTEWLARCRVPGRPGRAWSWHVPLPAAA